MRDPPYNIDLKIKVMYNNFKSQIYSRESPNEIGVKQGRSFKNKTLINIFWFFWSKYQNE